SSPCCCRCGGSARSTTGTRTGPPRTGPPTGRSSWAAGAGTTTSVSPSSSPRSPCWSPPSSDVTRTGPTRTPPRSGGGRRPRSQQGGDPSDGARRVHEEILERDGVLAGGFDGDPGGLEVHDTGGGGDGHVGALQPAAAAQGVHEGGGLGVGAVVDRLLEQLGPVAGDGRDGDAVVVGGRIIRAGDLGDLQDPGNVDVQVHQAARAPRAGFCCRDASSASSKTAWCSPRKRDAASTARARRPLVSSCTSRAR